MRRILMFLATGMVLIATAAQADVTAEFRSFAGAFVPTGDHELQSSPLVGAQLGIEMDAFHIVGTLAYTTPKPERPSMGEDVHIYQYDLGVELFRSTRMLSSGHWMFRPFMGAGLGARTFDFYDRDDTDAETNLAGYGTLGAEFQHENVAVRLEARDYVSRFRGLLRDETVKARNDLMLSVGLVLHAY